MMKAMIFNYDTKSVYMLCYDEADVKDEDVLLHLSDKYSIEPPLRERDCTYMTIHGDFHLIVDENIAIKITENL
jgi:hypothetical protein